MGCHKLGIVAALVSSIMGKLCREGRAEEDFSCLAEQFD